MIIGNHYQIVYIIRQAYRWLVNLFCLWTFRLPWSDWRHSEKQSANSQDDVKGQFNLLVIK
jgi:hypothetical protein